MIPPHIQVQAVHERQIQEALEQHRYDGETGTGLLQAVQALGGKLLGRHASAQTQHETPACAEVAPQPATTAAPAAPNMRLLVPLVIDERDAARA